MRVVLDTNVLISALLYHGRLTFIAKGMRRGIITPCFSITTWTELKRVLNYPHLSLPLLMEGVTENDLLSRLEIDAVFVGDIPSPFPIPADPSDEAMLACALAAHARALVSGDRHLLALKSNFPIPILNPQEFKSFLTAQ